MGFQQGVSGLNAAAEAIDVTGNNIANSQTVGFKEARASFADIFAGAGPGMGVRTSAITQNFNDGTPTTTNRQLDVAINGNGFYRLQDAAGGVYYSRNGEFTMDEDRNIRNMQGLYLTGYGAAGIPPTIVQGSDPVKLNVPQTSMLAKASTTGSMIVNLNSEHPIITATFDENNADTYSYTTSITAYDSLGNQHNISLYFIKSAATATTATWNVNAIDRSLPPPATVQNLPNFVFDNNGKLTTPAVGTPVPIAIATLGGSAAGSIDLDFTGSLQQNFGGDNTVKLIQNGYSAGNAVGFRINNDGTVVGSYSNQQQQLLGQIVLADFANVQGLIPEGNNVWLPSNSSGQVRLGLAGQGTFGNLLGGTVESSNVDVAHELVNLIQFQRNYQANSRTIATQSAILETLVSIR